jgi:hypothetical protein
VGTRRGETSARMGMAGFWKEAARDLGMLNSERRTYQPCHHWVQEFLSTIADFCVVDLRDSSGRYLDLGIRTVWL